MSIRHYGLQIGDKVEIDHFGNKMICTVYDFKWLDNNGCYLKDENDNVFEYVCEWCKKI